MASLDSLQARAVAAEGVVGRVVDDTPVAIRLKYEGTGTVTTVTVDTDQDITLITSDGGTEEFTFAEYTTIGALVDAINASAQWEALLLDALRADSTSGSPFVDDADVTISADGYYDALVDTSVALSYTYRLAYTRDIDDGKDKLKKTHRVHLKHIQYYANVNAASANGVRVYETTGGTETQIWQAASVDATDTVALNLLADQGAKITGREGYDLVVRVIDDTSLTDDTSGYLQVIGVRE